MATLRRLTGTKAGSAIEDMIAIADGNADRLEAMAILISTGNITQGKLLAEIARLINAEKKIMRLGTGAIQNKYPEED